MLSPAHFTSPVIEFPNVHQQLVLLPLQQRQHQQPLLLLLAALLLGTRLC
jgi:hypothetical protein